MADLFWPGDERSGSLLSQEAFLAAMVQVEAAWLQALVRQRIAGPEADDDLTGLVGTLDLDTLSADAEDGGNPAIPLVALLRSRLAERNPSAAAWMHRGLTSQDVIDTAVVLCLRAAGTQIAGDLTEQVRTLSALAEAHRRSVMTGRTLTRHAVPTTLGLKAATWLQSVVDAAEGVQQARLLPGQFGGAAGTMAAATRLAGSPQGAVQLIGTASALLDLGTRPPWHTQRSPISRFGDALVACTDAWGRIANDVLVLSRPEIGELDEPAKGGRGRSSTMPQKANPILSVLIRRAALAGPGLGAQLHLAAAGMVDERADGSWHLEWSTISTLVRRTAVAASHTTELLAGLIVHEDRMRATAEASAHELLAESAGSATRVEDYLGAHDLFIDAALERAARFEECP